LQVARFDKNRTHSLYLVKYIVCEKQEDIDGNLRRSADFNQILVCRMAEFILRDHPFPARFCRTPCRLKSALQQNEFCATLLITPRLSPDREKYFVVQRNQDWWSDLVFDCS
jgi:hypothetical protein